MIVRGIVAVGGIALGILIVLAAFESPIGVSFSRITQDLWGWTALVDLYLGFLIAAIIVSLVEKDRISQLFWIVPIFFLGNIWTALWFIFRWPRIVSLLRDGRNSSTP